MGREIRKVPANWQHPQEFNERRQKMEYVSIQDRTLDAWKTDAAEWDAGLEKWMQGKHPWQTSRVPTWRRHNQEADAESAAPDAIHYVRHEGRRPCPSEYLPFRNEDRVWFQMFQTVSEGTPITPPFATKAELVDYLCKHGTFWDEKPWNRGSAERFVEAEYAPSLIVETTPEGVRKFITAETM